MSNTVSFIKKTLRSVRGRWLRGKALKTIKTDDDSDDAMEFVARGQKAKIKLETMAEIFGCSEQEASRRVFERTLAAMPNKAIQAYLLPSLSITSCERISEELVRIQLADGRSFTGHRSNQKEYLLQQTLSHHLPESVDGDAYKLALDIERRYYGTVLQWFFPDRGIYIEGGCFTGMRAIRWYDLAIEPVKILAVEIGRTNCEILKTNIADNGLSASITPVHAGLWNESGEGVQKHSFSTRRFLETTDNWREHMRHEERVRLLTIGDLLDECEVEVADFLNLQVNGAELKVIDGMRRNLDRVKVISVASYYSQDGVRNSEVIEQMLTSAGCTVIHRTEQGRLAVVTPKFRDEILALPRRAIRRKIPKENLRAR